MLDENILISYKNIKLQVYEKRLRYEQVAFLSSFEQNLGQMLLFVNFQVKLGNQRSRRTRSEHPGGVSQKEITLSL